MIGGISFWLKESLLILSELICILRYCAVQCRPKDMSFLEAKNFQVFRCNEVKMSAREPQTAVAKVVPWRTSLDPPLQPLSSLASAVRFSNDASKRIVTNPMVEKPFDYLRETAGRLQRKAPTFRKAIAKDTSLSSHWHCEQTEYMTRHFFEDQDLGDCLGRCTYHPQDEIIAFEYHYPCSLQLQVASRVEAIKHRCFVWQLLSCYLGTSLRPLHVDVAILSKCFCSY